MRTILLNSLVVLFVISAIAGLGFGLMFIGTPVYHWVIGG